MTFNKVAVSGPGSKEGDGLRFLGFAFADVRPSRVTAWGALVRKTMQNLLAENES